MTRSSSKRVLPGLVALILVLSCLCLTCTVGLAATSAPDSTSTQGVTPAQPALIFFWLTALIVTLFLVVLMLSIAKGLMSSESWTLAEAISEEADPQPSPPAAGAKPVMVASSSRLIAFLGLAVILSLYLGVGYYMLWGVFVGRPLANLEKVTSYFYSGLVLFAPYLVNKFSSVFSVFKPTR